jgi:tannase/feruloyl esterase
MQIRWDGIQGGPHHESSAFTCRLGRWPVCHAIGPMPAAATPCTNLKFVQLQQTTITSAEDNTTGTFTVPNSNPPTILTGLPAFCRVTATLTPMSDSAIHIEVWLPETTWNGRFLGIGGDGFQGVITYGELSTGIRKGFAAANSDLGTGSSGCNPLYCGSAGNWEILWRSLWAIRQHRQRVFSVIRSGSMISATGRSI